MREDLAESKKTEVPPVHIVRVLSSPEVQEEDDYLDHGDVVLVHGCEECVCRREIVNGVPVRSVDLGEVVLLGPWHALGDVVPQIDELKRHVWGNDRQGHEVELSFGSCAAGLGAVVA